MPQEEIENGSCFISADWGSSHLRLRLVERKTLRVISEINSGRGIKDMNKAFLAQKEMDRLSFFTSYLNRQLPALGTDIKAGNVVISGMASSSIGMMESPYGRMPMSITAKEIPVQRIGNDSGPEILLISGMRSTTDVMRGEETQVIGMAGELDLHDPGTFILPGTHSKHIDYQEEVFHSFNTYMTGELFELLARKSILAYSIEAIEPDKERTEWFVKGLDEGFKGDFTAGLFGIRAAHLLQAADPGNNYHYLSGLLIGDEMKYLKNRRGKLVLGAEGRLFRAYQLALQILFPQRDIHYFDGPALQKCLLRGQSRILQYHEK